MNKNETIGELLTRGVSEVIDSKHLESALNSGKKLRVKLGIDPTGDKLHIGHAVPLWKLKAFQDLGHSVVLIIGDFTGLIGDTSDKDSERPMLTEEEVNINMKTYLDQVYKILDPKKTEIQYNSLWLTKLNVGEIAKIANQFGLHEFISRDNIARRMKAGKRVSLREVFYPLMQGYDSVAVKADVELGAIDQRFNLLSGRTIQKYFGQEPQDIMTFNYLSGNDGRKMSKSWGNSINLVDDAKDMFGKVMSVKDDLIVEYFELATKVPMAEVKTIEKELKSARLPDGQGTNPRTIKVRLATEIVTLYHGDKAAAAAADEFDKVFSKKEKPSEIEEMKVKSTDIVSVLVETELAGSKSEAKRLLEQKGVKIDDEVATEETKVRSGSLIQVGKRKFIKIK